MNKRVFFIHGWDSSTDTIFWPWLAEQLTTAGFEVHALRMPNAAEPKMNEWLETLTEAIGTPDENTYLVGHSLGCITALRYIEQLPAEARIGGAILIAAFTSHLGVQTIDSFFQTHPNWDAIKSHGARFAAIQSTNDPYVSVHYSDLLRKQLGANVQLLENRGHFSTDVNCTELPEARDALLEIAK